MSHCFWGILRVLFEWVFSMVVGTQQLLKRSMDSTRPPSSALETGVHTLIPVFWEHCHSQQPVTGIGPRINI